MKKKDVTIKEAEKIISEFNILSKDSSADHDHKKKTKENEESVASKSSSNIKKKTKKVSKK